MDIRLTIGIEPKELAEHPSMQEHMKSIEKAINESATVRLSLLTLVGIIALEKQRLEGSELV